MSTTNHNQTKAKSKPKKTKRSSNVKPIKLVALILMLIPGVALIGFIIYVLLGTTRQASTVEIILAVLSIFLGFIPAIFLWLNAFGIIKL